VSIANDPQPELLAIAPDVKHDACRVFSGKHPQVHRHPIEQATFAIDEMRLLLFVDDIGLVIKTRPERRKLLVVGVDGSNDLRGGLGRTRRANFLIRPRRAMTATADQGEAEQEDDSQYASWH